MTRKHVTPPPRKTGTPQARARILRWQLAYGTLGVPQAAAPIAFGLVALPLTGSVESGATMVFAMTTAQVLGAVPVSRLGRRFNSVHYLRALIAVRTIALAAVTVLAAVGAPFAFLVAAVVAAGLVNGAAYGYQRLLLNHLVSPGGLPRALGVAATLNEINFVLSPVLASLLGAVSPVGAMAAITVLGVGPMLLLPPIPQARGPEDGRPGGTGGRVPAEVLLWLFCAAAGGAAVAAVEVGAVSFALSFGLAPGWAFLFASVLCVGAVTGGVWVSLRNRVPERWKVAFFLVMSTAASGVILAGGHIAPTLAGAAVLGFFLPLLGTFYSLVVDELAPPGRRAEMFALLRTANSLGVIATSGLLALQGLPTALLGSAALLLLASCLAALHAVLVRRGRRPQPLTHVDGREDAIA
ncbi:MFS transporter [Streptomonospora nanhaiensis]|uniref:MFS transporter n=1 Tax=Streptomonospora nanhaiensis TaxID=1323731 RepID=A0ABY6YG87_9ACTN|nr:MFS transporter [Streptomonospora nanhaiensis]WAE71258.1 MFS transporter [Streptomonospora nanhaiensis]